MTSNTPDNTVIVTSTAHVIPPTLFFRESDGITDISNDATFPQIFSREWTMYLGKGVCPNGEIFPSSFVKKTPVPTPAPTTAGPTTAPTTPSGTMVPTIAPTVSVSTLAPTLTPVQPDVSPTSCLPYIGTTVWTNIDLENQYLMQESNGTPEPVYSNMVQASKNFRQAYDLSVLGCILSWVLIIFSVYDAVNTEDMVDGHAGMTFEEVDIEGRGSIAPFQMGHPETIAMEAEEEKHAAIATQLIDDNVQHLMKLNVNALNRMVENEEKNNTVTYTVSITVEMVSFMILFGFAASVLKLLHESDMTEIPNAWRGFFPSCNITMTTGSGPAILLYQCISMGAYTITLLLCELYYVKEYLTQCMYNVFTHPDDRAAERLHKERQGETHHEVAWTGPVFMSRIHLTKVRAVKGVFEAIFGRKKNRALNTSHVDGWHTPNANQNAGDVRAQQAAMAKKLGVHNQGSGSTAGKATSPKTKAKVPPKGQAASALKGKSAARVKKPVPTPTSAAAAAAAAADGAFAL